MCQPMVKGYFVIPQIQPLRDTNYSTSPEPTLWRHILYFQQLQPSADICYIFYQQNQPSGRNSYKEGVFSVSYLHKHPFYLLAIKISFRVYYVDCKGILTPILRTLVQKSTLLLQNRGHVEVLKKDPFFREIRTEGAAPLCT